MDSGLSGIYKPALMDNALAAAMRESKKSAGFNFRRDEFALKRKFLGPGKDIKRIAIFICTFFVLMWINTCVDYYYINKKYLYTDIQLYLIPNVLSEKLEKRKQSLYYCGLIIVYIIIG